MARKTQTITTVTDDLTGATVTESDVTETTITVGELSGKLDLTAESLSALSALVKGDGADALRALLSAKQNGKRSGGSGRSSEFVTGTTVTASEIRAWQAANGKNANKSGRIGADAVAEYLAANPDKRANAEATEPAADAGTEPAASASGKRAPK